jgi:hypothetical protein
MAGRGGRPVLWLVAVLAGVSVGCVKIETGRTPEEARESADVRAKTIRGEWASRLMDKTPPQIADLVAGLISSVTRQYLDYGGKVAEQWREATAGRGQEVSAEEMRRVVSAWTKSEQPILTANEDNIEYGVQRLRETGHLNSDGVDLLDRIVAEYYNTYTAVFLPAGKVDDYETRMTEQRRKNERATEEFRSSLGLN